MGWARPLAALLTLLVAALASATDTLAQASARSQPHNNSIAIVIGNSRYDHTTPVPYAHADARAITAYLAGTLGFRPENIALHLDIGRERMEMLFGDGDRANGEIMDRLLDRPRVEDRGDIYVFYSGHGVPDPDAVHDDGRRAFLLPVDVRQDRIRAAAFPLDRLQQKLELLRGHIPASRRVLLMMDACFSGRTPAATEAAASGPDASLFRFSRGSFSVSLDAPRAGFTRIVAATGDQVAYWDEERKLGLFTSLFLRGVAGDADKPGFGDGDGEVTGPELERYLTERLAAESRRRFSRTQRPAFSHVDGFLFAPRGRFAPLPAAAAQTPVTLLAPSAPGSFQQLNPSRHPFDNSALGGPAVPLPPQVQPQLIQPPASRVTSSDLGASSLGSSAISPVPGGGGPSLWTHNGSTMRLIAEGAQRRFVYERPRAGLVPHGVRRDTVLFEGRRDGDRYSGTAYRFSAECGLRSFAVEGQVENGDRRVRLTGRYPVFGPGCTMSGRTERETLIFTYAGR
jgi:Caspase domain